tara:strand:+ start:20 stop:133 length:114 start_codon:yes stop_codon:yes gene_type:complete
MEWGLSSFTISLIDVHFLAIMLEKIELKREFEGIIYL